MIGWWSPQQKDYSQSTPHKRRTAICQKSFEAQGGDPSAATRYVQVRAPCLKGVSGLGGAVTRGGFLGSRGTTLQPLSCRPHRSRLHLLLTSSTCGDGMYPSIHRFSHNYDYTYMDCGIVYSSRSLSELCRGLLLSGVCALNTRANRLRPS